MAAGPTRTRRLAKYRAGWSNTLPTPSSLTSWQSACTWGRTFKRRFKEATGETPLSYLQHLRIEAAKHGLESTRRQTAQIIWDVGYEDASSFRRLFKRNVGCTMEEYRRRFSYVTPKRSKPSAAISADSARAH
uniref:helix-turn-helix domain-containing protein n=1 Tax=Marinobacter similis TaxID=1420916 RepID=UPI001F00F1BA|nr:helix-turn-helix domain-containing protein [Marinobacter similis]